MLYLKLVDYIQCIPIKSSQVCSALGAPVPPRNANDHFSLSDKKWRGKYGQFLINTDQWGTPLIIATFIKKNTVLNQF